MISKNFCSNRRTAISVAHMGEHDSKNCQNLGSFSVNDLAYGVIRTRLGQLSDEELFLVFNDRNVP